jgi:hypothetical protein
MRRVHSHIQGLGIESWQSLLASRSGWFFWQTSRWQTRPIIATTTIITTTITIRGPIDSSRRPVVGLHGLCGRQQKTTRVRQSVRY